WPPAPSPDPMPPPSSSRVPDTAWAEVKLTPAELAVKEEALTRYRSQAEVMGDLFRRFERENELFGRVKSEILAKIAAIHYLLWARATTAPRRGAAPRGRARRRSTRARPRPRGRSLARSRPR